MPALTEKRLRERVGRNVRSARTQMRVTQEEAAARARIDWRHWQKIEAGEVNLTLRTLLRVARALEADPGALLAKRRSG